MLIEYIEEAMNLAHYEIIEDEEPFYGEIPQLQGVWATGITLEDCRRNLMEAIEGWIIISLKKNIEIPKLKDIDIHEMLPSTQ